MNEDEDCAQGDIVVSSDTHRVETRYMSVAEAARVLGLSRMTMYRKIHGGQVRANRVGRKLRVFRPDIEKMSEPVYLSAEEVD